jgi:hypothetical protein
VLANGIVSRSQSGRQRANPSEYVAFTTTDSSNYIPSSNQPNPSDAEYEIMLSMFTTALCHYIRTPSPSVRIITSDCLERQVVEAGQEFVISFSGFAPNRPYRTRIGGPGNSLYPITQIQTDSSGTAQIPWFGSVDSPAGIQLGKYIVAANYGNVNILANFEIVRAQSPRVVVTPPAAAAGTTFHIILAGFQPGRVVQIRLYDRNRRYLTSLHPVTPDGDGIAVSSVVSRPSDSKGNYYVATDSDKFERARFTLQ